MNKRLHLLRRINLLAYGAASLLLCTCQPEIQHQDKAPRPYVAWLDDGDVDTAQYFFNDQFLGTGEIGFNEQLRMLESLPDGETIAVFVPFSQFYVTSSDPMASIPVFRQPEFKKRFSSLGEHKSFIFEMHFPEAAQQYKEEVPGISFKGTNNPK